MRLYTFIVAGGGSFPFNMLFMDRCWPASKKDAELIELACPTVAPMVRIAMSSYQSPRGELWAQYKWPVKRVEG